MSKKPNKPFDDDDGRTVVNMNVDGMKGYLKPEHRKERDQVRKMKLTKSERRAIFWGSFKAMIPTLFFILAGFGVTILLIWMWLR